MPSGPLAKPGSRPTLILALAMSTFGFFGAFRSANLLGSDAEDVARANREAVQSQEDEPPADHSPLVVLPPEFTPYLVTSPVRRAQQVGNLLASALLIVASMLLTVRRASALWWASQALIANVVYSAASIGVAIYLQYAHRGALVRGVRQVHEALATQGLPPAPPGTIDGTILGVTILFAATSAGLGLIYVLLWRVSRRDDVQRFVAGA